MVVTYGVVHMKEDMIESEQDRNDMNGLALSILVAKVESTLHGENCFRVANVESDYYYYYYNMEVHYNHRNVVQEPYLHLPVACSFMLPWHVMAQV